MPGQLFVNVCCCCCCCCCLVWREVSVSEGYIVAGLKYITVENREKVYLLSLKQQYQHQQQHHVCKLLIFATSMVCIDVYTIQLWCVTWHAEFKLIFILWTYWTAVYPTFKYTNLTPDSRTKNNVMILYYVVFSVPVTTFAHTSDIFVYFDQLNPRFISFIYIPKLTSMQDYRYIKPT